VSAREPSILALDLGTTELKAALVTADGRLIGSARARYPLALDAATGCAEQDPEAWWAAIESVSRELFAAAGGPVAGGGQVAAGPVAGGPVAGGPVAAICCVGQGPTMVPVARDGWVTHPAITWMDGRPAAEAPELERATGRTGWGLGILPAARWLERNAPREAAQTAWYLNAWEWAAFRLTGVAVMTRSLGQVLPDPDLAAAVMDAGRLPPVVATGTIVGELTADAAAALGCAAGIPVVAGTVDSFASFHGAGLTEPGDAVDTGGTSGGLAVYWDAPADVPGSWVAAAPLPDRWIVGGAMTATGKALDWLAEDVVGGVSPKTLIAEAARVPPGADGLLFLPYLAGERSPIWDPGARGAFIGLTLAHGRAHLARAVLEAAALALRHVAAPILAAGLRIDQLVVTGGTARGDVWNRIKADVLQVPVDVPAIHETAVAGAAILGALGVGWHANPVTAIEAMVRIDHRLEPDVATRARYDALYAAYVGAWPALAPIVRQLRAMPAGG
jgi:xylulokinase